MENLEAGIYGFCGQGRNSGRGCLRGTRSVFSSCITGETRLDVTIGLLGAGGTWLVPLLWGTL